MFSRIFAFPSPSAFRLKARELQDSKALRTALKRLGERFRTAEPDSLLRSAFHLYRYPLVLDRVVPAGPGHGHWRTYGVSDGLYNVSMTMASVILQDREGNLWFSSSTGGGVIHSSSSSNSTTSARTEIRIRE